MELCNTPFSTTLHPIPRPPSTLLCTPSNSLASPLRSHKTQNPNSTSLRFSSSFRQPFPLCPPRPFSCYFSKSPTIPLLGSSATAAAASSPSVADADVEKDKLPADLDVTEIQEPNSRVRLTVNVPPIVCEDCYRRLLREMMKQAKIPGFRPGKVPENILVNHVGEQNVKRATIESILNRTLPHAMSSVTGKALKDSIRIATKFSDMEQAYASNKSLRYDVLVDVTPEVKWNPEGGYKNLKIVVEMDNEIVAEEACERELKRRHKSLGALKVVTDRGLQVGDVVVLDISATSIGHDGSEAEKIPSAESNGFHFDTEDGDQVLPGFLDSIIGIQQGETRSFPLLFPESWQQENLRGVQAQFTVECKELFYRDLPELNDSLAEKLQPGCSSLDQVKESLLRRCQELEQRAKEQATDNAILDQLRQMVEVDIPWSILEEQGRQLYGAKLLQVQASMKLNEQQLASLTSAKAVKEYLEQEKENIISVIKQNMAVGDIFRRENIQLSTKELVEEVQNSIVEFKKHEQDYDEERIKEQVQEVLEGAKVLEWLKERAEIRYITR